MPVILIENVAAGPTAWGDRATKPMPRPASAAPKPPAGGLGMLPLFDDGGGFFRRGPLQLLTPDPVDNAPMEVPAPQPVRPLIPLFGFPPAPGPLGGGFLPPWLSAAWASRQTPSPSPSLPILTPPQNTGPLPPSPVVVMDHANPGNSDSPVLGAPAPATGAPASTMTPIVPLPVVVAPVPAPAPVSAAQASMFATPSSAASSMYASTGAPTGNSMYGSVQGSSSLYAKVSGANALSGLPEPGVPSLLGLAVLSGLGWLGYRLFTKRGRR